MGTYRHFYAWVINEHHFGFLAVQEYRNRFLAEFVICKIPNWRFYWRTISTVQVYRYIGKYCAQRNGIRFGWWGRGTVSQPPNNTLFIRSVLFNIKTDFGKKETPTFSPRLVRFGGGGEGWFPVVFHPRPTAPLSSCPRPMVGRNAATPSKVAIQNSRAPSPVMPLQWWALRFDLFSEWGIDIAKAWRVNDILELFLVKFKSEKLMKIVTNSVKLKSIIV